MKTVVVCVAVFAAACASDARRVGGKVRGMWDGADGVTMRLVTDDVDTLLTVTANGAFQFPQALPVGTSYVVGIASDPIDHVCELAGGGNGVIGDEDASLDVACVGPRVAIDFNGRGFGVFDPSQDQQQIPSSPFADHADLTIHAAPGITAQLFGEPVPLDTPISRPFEIGPTGLAVTFSAPRGLSKYFPIYIDRGATPAIQELYAKAPEATRSFGHAIALDGDTLVVSASLPVGASQSVQPGVVFVFVRVGGAWSEQARIGAPDGEDAHSFGTSVAILGDTLVASGSVAAHVYTRRDGIWSADTALVPATGAKLGGPVAIATNIIVAAAPSNTVNGVLAAGEVYVFRGGGSSWVQQAVLVSDKPTAEQRFGSVVAVDYGIVAVSGGSSGLGAVYVFREAIQVPNSTWSLQQVLLGSVNGAFGAALALAHGVLVIGAPAEGNSGVESAASGVVYIYGQTFYGADRPDVWMQLTSIHPPSESGARGFGSSVAFSGDLLAIGAPVDGSSPATGRFDPAFAQTGAVLLFGRQGGTWKQVGYHKASNPGAADLFGNSVALSSDTLAVGAPGEDGPGMGLNAADQGSDTARDTGAVYTFR